MPGLSGVSVTSFTPTPPSPNAGINSNVPAGVARCDRNGWADGSCERKPASSASIAARIGRARRSSSPSSTRIYSSPRYASRICGLLSNPCAVSARTIWPVCST